MTEQDDDHDGVKLMTNSTKTKRACSIAQRQRGAGARLVDDTGRAWMRWRGETPRTHTEGCDRGNMAETRAWEGADADHRRGLNMTADSWQRVPGRTAEDGRG
ncbi:hypothetical protein F2Q70_00026356 [Brassica cretica]|uniref:Uncharacterized protein n=2 Tax=Brassica cretica TaxID=69181 RepID=A0A8S9IK57_BRACR|nr:hypothetical protein F2Q68_00025913 [Brassica cretica]KAF2601219.1 hypothetical protein F2Q70_00026356 [Brassica cretica]KAF3576007.1 hypothetical protein DY000_02031919 [Brassica cretica]